MKPTHALWVLALRLAVAGGLGGCWSLGALGVALSPMIVWLWRTAGTRGEAGTLVALYYAAAAAVPLGSLGAAGYQGVSVVDLTLCALASVALVSGAWSAAWSPAMRTSKTQAAMRTAAVLTTMALPGLGILGVAHPLTAAGLWLPGAGWAGLALHAAVLAALPMRARPLGVWACAVACVAAWGHAPAAAHEGRVGAMFGVHTRLPVAAAADYGGQLQTALGAQAQAPASMPSLMVYGEGLGGVWSRTMRDVWEPLFARASAAHAELVVGATQITYARDSVRYEAVAVVRHASGSESLVRQRAPMPFLLWRPWQTSGYAPHWFEPGVVELVAGRAGVVICYEQLIVFPVLWSIASGAQRLIGLANVHELGGGAVQRWQAASMEAWARLFDLPVVLAVNE